MRALFAGLWCTHSAGCALYLDSEAPADSGIETRGVAQALRHISTLVARTLVLCARMSENVPDLQAPRCEDGGRTPAGRGHAVQASSKLSRDQDTCYESPKRFLR